MTDKLSNYSTTPGSNNAASPDGWPEGQTAGSVNNSDREFAARVREFYEDPTWIDFGHTVVSSTASSIKLSTDLTAVYTAGRPIRVNQSGSQTGYVTASAYSAPDTSITVSGFTVSLPTQVEVGAITSAAQLPSNLALTTTGSITVAHASITVATIGSLTASAIVTSGPFSAGTITATDYLNSNGDPFTRAPYLDVKTSGTAATWTWPTGVTAVEITLVGGGGGGRDGGVTAAGNGGNSSIVYNSVTVTAGGGGGGGASGATGATATNGDINIPSQKIAVGSSEGRPSALGFGHGAVVSGETGIGYGGGGGGGGSTSTGSSGAAAIYRVKKVAGLNTITYTVGSGGTAGTSGGAGTAGVVIFRY